MDDDEPVDLGGKPKRHHGRDPWSVALRPGDMATPRVPNDELAAPLRALGVELHLVGDAYAPRFVVTATAEGHKVGNLI